MGTGNSLSLLAKGDREIVMQRIFDAPRELVFDAFTKPELVQRWLLGPPGWTMPVCQIDLRAGGAFRYVWRGPDGKEIGMGGAYREVSRPERIIHTELFDEDWTGGVTIVTMTYTQQDGKTRLDCSVLYASGQARDAVLTSPMEQGVSQGYDNLDSVLVKLHRDS